MLGGLTLGALRPIPALADSYQVQPGDTLSSIAERYGTTQGVLRALNPAIDSADLLYIGQEIDLPDNAVPVPITREATTHVVQPGETLSGIAALHQVSISSLLALNPGQTPDLLFSGVELIIRGDGTSSTTTTPVEITPPIDAAIDPPSGSTPTADSPQIAGVPVTLYLVQAGDTFTGLALRFDTSVETLIVFNLNIRPDALFIDSLLWVPATGGSIPPFTARPSFIGDAPISISTIPYLVVPGDSATAIAQRNNLTLEQLGALNPNLSLDLIYVGQILLVPGSPSQTLSADPALSGDPTQPDLPAGLPTDELTTYDVRPGDTGYGVAGAFEIDLDQLAALNPSIDVSNLLIGQILTVPDIDIPPPPPGTVPAGPPLPNIYIVQSGDNLATIAARFDTDTGEIIGLNPGLNPDLLSIEQELHLPGTMPVPQVARTITVESGGGLEIIAARFGVLPHTLIANNPSLGAWVPAGTSLAVPNREGVLVTVQPGDTLGSIARIFGSSVDAVSSDPRSGVIGPNQLVIGQQIIIPIQLPDFAWPVFGGILTDGFGLCRTLDCGVVHHGVDISKGLGTPVGAIALGTVSFTGGSYCCGLGFHVVIQHDNGFESLYAHLNGAPPVFEGQQIAQGDTIGFVGTTGFSTGPHLHLELRHNDWLLNALNYLP